MTIFIFGLLIARVDNYAHIGGFVGGYMTSMWLDPLKPERVNHMIGALICLLATVLAILASILSMLRLGSEARSSATCVQIDDPLDRAAAHAAEADRIAREHDAIGLGPIESARLVRRPFERADLPANTSATPGTFVSHACCSRKSASISASGALRARMSRALASGSSRLCFSNASLSHGVGSGVPAVDEIPPFQLWPDRAARSRSAPTAPDDRAAAGLVGDIRRVVLVGQRREVMAELVHEHVLRRRRCRRTPWPDR